MYNTPAASQLLRPPRRQRDHHQGCQAMRQGFSTLLLTMEELGAVEEEDRPRLVDTPTTQWPRRANPTTLWELLDHHLQHLAQEALV